MSKEASKIAMLDDLDLDELDNDLLETDNDFDLLALSSESVHQSMMRKQTITNEAEPTLESILNESDDYENDEILQSLQTPLTTLEITEPNKQRTQSYSNLTEKNGIVCKQAVLKMISSQLVNAIERSAAGLPTSLAIGQLIAVGTSRGLILLFDSLQVLKLYITTEYRDAISAMSFNNKCDRLLVGNAAGYIFMFETSSGKCLRQINDAHPSGNSILNLKFTDDTKLACFSDSGGSVFMLEFKRVMGVRGADAVCLFSGSRGEVCNIEPLKFEKFSETLVDKLSVDSNNTSQIKKNLSNINNLFNKYSLLAMASFTKIIVVTLRPKLTVLFTYPLNGNAKYLPILSWQFVIFQQNSNNELKLPSPKRFITPILAAARESTIHFFQINYYQNDNEITTQVQTTTTTTTNPKQDDDPIQNHFKFVQLQKCEFNFKIYNFSWLNAKTLAILDQTEKLHICDIRSNQTLQTISNLSSLELVYNSCFFKSLATGGYVSQALAYAGDNACYQTIQSYLGQMFILGSKSLSLFALQNWSARIDDFVNDNCIDLALDLALSMYRGETKALIGLPIESQLRKEKIQDKIIDLLYLYVQRSMKQDCPANGKLDLLEKHYKKCSNRFVNVCILIDRQDILFDNIYSLISCDFLFESFFLESLEEYILNGSLRFIPPLVLKNFIDYYSKNEDLLNRLERCIIHFNIESIDLHNLIQICRNNRLLDGFIYLYNKAFQDYTTPFNDILLMMEPMAILSKDSRLFKQMDKSRLDLITIYCNKLLVYLHCCLCGQSYPYGKMEDDQLSDKVRRITFDYLIAKQSDLLKDSDVDYPILRVFLCVDALDFLNVIAMAFNESSFEAVIGLEKKQNLIDILIELSLNNSDSSSFSNQLVGNLFTFLARQIANKTNNIQVDDLIFSQIIEYLCNSDDLDRVEEREQSLISLLNSFSTEINDRFSLKRLLSLALQAKFYRVCEILYEILGEYYELVDCYLSIENSIERQKQIFEVVRNIINILFDSNASNIKERSQTGNYNRSKRSATLIDSRDLQLRYLKDKLTRYGTIKQMVNINACETIHLLWIEMDIDLKNLIKTIKNYGSNTKPVDIDYSDLDDNKSVESLLINDLPNETANTELLFKFMKGLFMLADLIKSNRVYINYMSQFSAEYCQLYVDLICLHEPDKLLNFLKTSISDYSYGIEECLRICRERQVWDAAAYLLEKSGQIEAAFSLNLEKLSTLIRDLQKKLDSSDDIEQSKLNIDAMLVKIIQLCQRNSQSLNDSVKEKVWFSLFDEVMRPIQSICTSKNERLNETRDFFKKLGAHIINSMVGYLSLTTIIDRIICDPLYGASNFGDIKYLIYKMLEMCSYEEILLDKTASLVSGDVYSKMQTYKKYACKSFSSFTNFCQYCSKLLDTSESNDKQLDSNDSLTNAVSIYHCGHSFHQICLEMMQVQKNTACPVCNSSMTSTSCSSTSVKSYKKYKKQPKPIDYDSVQPSTSVAAASISPEQISNELNQFSFSDIQIDTLKAIRTRNLSQFKINDGYASPLLAKNSFSFNSKRTVNTMLEKNSKLQMAPANLTNFI